MEKRSRWLKVWRSRACELRDDGQGLLVRFTDAAGRLRERLPLAQATLRRLGSERRLCPLELYVLTVGRREVWLRVPRGDAAALDALDALQARLEGCDHSEHSGDPVTPERSEDLATVSVELEGGVTVPELSLSEGVATVLGDSTATVLADSTATLAPDDLRAPRSEVDAGQAEAVEAAEALLDAADSPGRGPADETPAGSGGPVGRHEFWLRRVPPFFRAEWPRGGMPCWPRRFVLEPFSNASGPATGSFGQVFLCRHPRSGEQVCVKQVGARRQPTRRRLLNEEQLQSEACAASEHIVELLSVAHTPSAAEPVLSYFVLELCEGGDLFDFVLHRYESGSRSCLGLYLEAREVFDFSSDLSAAVQHLHAKRILHRDIKPENVFVANGRAKLGDFGLAGRADASGRAYSSVGTPLYSAPEQVLAAGYSYPVDLFAVGVTICFLLTCASPFEADVRAAGRSAEVQSRAVQAAARRAHYPALTSLRLDDPALHGLRAIVLEMLAVDPGARPTAGQLASSLQILAATARR